MLFVGTPCLLLKRLNDGIIAYDIDSVLLFEKSRYWSLRLVEAEIATSW